MKKLIAKLKLVFTYGDELEQLLENAKEINEKELKRIESLKLDLCKKHQQRSFGTHHSEHHCDYCELLRRVKLVETE